VGNEFVRTEPEALERYGVDCVVPAVAVQPLNAEQAAEIVKIAVQEKLSLIASGARTSLGIGMPPSRYDVALDMDAGTRRCCTTIQAIWTISVNAGTPLAELAKILAEKNQPFLPTGDAIF